jgi:hypothetical protein
MENDTKQQLIKRLKSLLWRVGAYAVVAGLASVPDFLGIMKFDPTLIALVALVCGEITKYVNTYCK